MRRNKTRKYKKPRKKKSRKKRGRGKTNKNMTSKETHKILLSDMKKKWQDNNRQIISQQNESFKKYKKHRNSNFIRGFVKNFGKPPNDDDKKLFTIIMKYLSKKNLNDSENKFIDYYKSKKENKLKFVYINSQNRQMLRETVNMKKKIFHNVYDNPENLKKLAENQKLLKIPDKDGFKFIKKNQSQRKSPIEFITIPDKQEEDDPTKTENLFKSYAKYTGGRKKTRKKRGGDIYFDKLKDITKQYLKLPEIKNKIKKHKKNKLTIDEIIDGIKEDKINKIIKAYIVYLKKKIQKGGDGKKFEEQLDALLLRRQEPSAPTIQGNEDDINLAVQVLQEIINERERRDARRRRIDAGRRRNRFNFVHMLVHGLFTALFILYLLSLQAGEDLEITRGMNPLAQAIIIGRDIGLLRFGANIFVSDLWWNIFRDLQLPGGFRGEDFVIQRQIARFLTPFFSLPEEIVEEMLDNLQGGYRKKKTRKKRGGKKLKKKKYGKFPIQCSREFKDFFKKSSQRLKNEIIIWIQERRRRTPPMSEKAIAHFLNNIPKKLEKFREQQRNRQGGYRPLPPIHLNKREFIDLIKYNPGKSYKIMRNVRFDGMDDIDDPEYGYNKWYTGKIEYKGFNEDWDEDTFVFDIYDEDGDYITGWEDSYVALTDGPDTGALDYEWTSIRDSDGARDIIFRGGRKKRKNKKKTRKKRGGVVKKVKLNELKINGNYWVSSQDGGFNTVYEGLDNMNRHNFKLSEGPTMRYPGGYIRITEGVTDPSYYTIRGILGDITQHEASVANQMPISDTSSITEILPNPNDAMSINSDSSTLILDGGRKRRKKKTRKKRGGGPVFSRSVRVEPIEFRGENAFVVESEPREGDENLPVAPEVFSANEYVDNEDHGVINIINDIQQNGNSQNRNRGNRRTRRTRRNRRTRSDRNIGRGHRISNSSQTTMGRYTNNLRRQQEQQQRQNLSRRVNRAWDDSSSDEENTEELRRIRERRAAQIITRRNQRHDRIMNQNRNYQ